MKNIGFHIYNDANKMLNNLVNIGIEKVDNSTYYTF